MQPSPPGPAPGLRRLAAAGCPAVVPGTTRSRSPPVPTGRSALRRTEARPRAYRRGRDCSATGAGQAKLASVANVEPFRPTSSLFLRAQGVRTGLKVTTFGCAEETGTPPSTRIV